MIKSPKEKFQQSQIRTGQWAQIVANPLFDEACDAALLQMQANTPIRQSDPQHDANCQNQLIGAWTVIKILKTLHETTQEPEQKIAKGLNYQAGV